MLVRGNLAAKPVAQRSAQEMVQQLKLVPNTEKGYFAQTFEDPATVNNRSVSTLIYYLLEGSAGKSKWHRVDAAEVWHFYAGAPLTLSLSLDHGAPVAEHVLGPDVFNEQAPQVVVPRGTWQSARSLGPWTLVGTTVAPGFVASGFELAPPGWEPWV
ncbi:RmlC-like jelly roll fold protein [Ophiocordyceps sinensis CO18]|uniref:RmlC-like jelly roll fold protein n=1 Tax=Ophiocordyceps sinensis (strain Co18 / CGMCC 3.14243) TaxID=911162 RepID=T5A8X0_OPHSC|nr:RmlC-like jelly roll fold protein [Ophiocordyceps sinensis CO18]